MVWKNIEQAHTFLCLTDLDPEMFNRDFIEIVKLRHDWPGWWSTVELFRPDIFEDGDQVLYFDLDTIITRDISAFDGAIDCDLLMLRDFYRPTTHMGSGMMGWTAGQFTDLYKLWRHTANRESPIWRRGDQAFIQKVTDPKRIRYWQDEFPDKVVSYKIHCKDGLPPKAHVVCFHGKPRPSDLVDPWIIDRWPLNSSGENIL